MAVRGGFAGYNDAIGRERALTARNHALDGFEAGFVGDDEARFAVPRHERYLALAICIVHGNHHGADGSERKPGQRECRLVRQHHRDMSALANADGHEPGREREHARRELRVGQGLLGLEEIPDESVAALSRGRNDELGDVPGQGFALDPSAALRRGWKRLARDLLATHHRRRAHEAYHTAFQSVYLSIACSDLSRPWPDCLNPPNGTDMLPRSKQFTQTTPARIALAARCAFRMSFVHTPAARP